MVEILGIQIVTLAEIVESLFRITGNTYGSVGRTALSNSLGDLAQESLSLAAINFLTYFLFSAHSLGVRARIFLGFV